MSKCPNCGHDVILQDSTSVANIEQLLGNLMHAGRNQYLSAVADNGKLLDHIRELWDENQALKAQLAPDQPSDEAVRDE